MIEILVKLKDFVPLFQSALWIFFIFALLMYFKRPIDTLVESVLERVKKGSPFKAGPLEFGSLETGEESKVPDEINNIISKVSSLPSEIKNEITKDLQSLIEELMADALDRIRLNTAFDKIRIGTTFLWNDLVIACEKKSEF